VLYNECSTRVTKSHRLVDETAGKCNDNIHCLQCKLTAVSCPTNVLLKKSFSEIPLCCVRGNNATPTTKGGRKERKNHRKCPWSRRQTKHVLLKGSRVDLAWICGGGSGLKRVFFLLHDSSHIRCRPCIFLLFHVIYFFFLTTPVQRRITCTCFLFSLSLSLSLVV